jgi:hypothetical protein
VQYKLRSVCVCVCGGVRVYHTNQYTVLLITCIDRRCDQQPAVNIYPITKLAEFCLLPPTRGWPCEVEHSNPVANVRRCLGKTDLRSIPIFPLSTQPSLYLWLYSPCEPWPLFSFLIYTQSVGLLVWGISSSQGRYLHTE